MNARIIIGIVMFSLLMGSVTATNINLITHKTKVGVYIDDYYYVVTIENKKIQRIELNSQEEVNYVIRTTKEKVIDFMIQYPNLSKIERIQLAMKNFDIPFGLMMKISGIYLKGE